MRCGPPRKSLSGGAVRISDGLISFQLLIATNSVPARRGEYMCTSFVGNAPRMVIMFDVVIDGHTPPRGRPNHHVCRHVFSVPPRRTHLCVSGPRCPSLLLRHIRLPSRSLQVPLQRYTYRLHGVPPEQGNRNRLTALCRLLAGQLDTLPSCHGHWTMLLLPFDRSYGVPVRLGFEPAASHMF
jgi:hypothetical protein